MDAAAVPWWVWPLALFALIVLVSYLRIIPVLPRLQAVLAAGQVLVLLAAMSGLF